MSTATPAAHGRPAAAGPTCFVYGPTDFVEAVADILVDPGHDPRRVCTERPGPGARRAAEPDR